jgi:hypothetical protein
MFDPLFLLALVLTSAIIGAACGIVFGFMLGAGKRRYGKGRKRSRLHGALMLSIYRHDTTKLSSIGYAWRIKAETTNALHHY